MEIALSPNFYFEIGGITFRVRADLPITERTFHRNVLRYRCICPGNDLVEVWHHFRIPEYREGEFGAPVYQQASWTFFHKEKGWVFRQVGQEEPGMYYEQLAFFTEDYTTGEIFHPNAEAFAAGDLKSITLRSTDQILVSQLLASRDGCILHSAAMEIDEWGFLFLGHSGAGKSTILRLLKEEGRVIGEDRNILRFHPDGPRVYSFFHPYEDPSITPGSANLRAIFLLEQAACDRLIPVMNRKEVIGRLLPLLIKAMTTPDWWKKTLDTVEKIAEEIPIYRLQFQKDGQLKDLLYELL